MSDDDAAALCCVQCSLKALLDGELPPVFAESPEAHMARVHPDPEATHRERLALEARLVAIGEREEMLDEMLDTLTWPTKES
jgi:hypothetical protein